MTRQQRWSRSAKGIAAQLARNAARRAMEPWHRVCIVCGAAFTQHRAGRPRLACSVACANERHTRQRRAAADRCQACGWRHEPEPCGGGYVYCPRTETHFRPAEQLELGK